MSKKNEATDRKEQPCEATCPVGMFFSLFGSCMNRESDFYKHVNQSKVEMLKALKSLVDERIERLEKSAAKGKQKKAAKINVE